MITVNDVLTLLTEKAPVELALGFDNVGLLVGRRNKAVHRVLTALDITDDVIQEAIHMNADLIVSHHPLFFELKTVSDQSWTAERALTLAENGIAAICMHTNLDAAEGGVNDALIAALGAESVEILDPESQIGRIGTLSAAITMKEFLAITKDALKGNGLRYHDAGKPVHKIAVCGGSGGSDIPLAYNAGCDTYVTADVKYDQFFEAKHLGINLIDADHFCTENVVIPVLREWITNAFPVLDVHISGIHGQTAQFC